MQYIVINLNIISPQQIQINEMNKISHFKFFLDGRKINYGKVKCNSKICHYNALVHVQTFNIIIVSSFFS